MAVFITIFSAIRSYPLTSRISTHTCNSRYKVTIISFCRYIFLISRLHIAIPQNQLIYK